MSKTFLFQAIKFRQTIQFSISMLLVLFNPDRALSGATTSGQSGPGSDGNKGILRIPQSSSITGISPPDCLLSYPGHTLGSLTLLQRCSRCILQPQPTGQNYFWWFYSWCWGVSIKFGWGSLNVFWFFIVPFGVDMSFSRLINESF